MSAFWWLLIPLRAWRRAPRPRHWWLVWEIGSAIAEAGFRRIPAYMAGVRALAEGGGDPPAGFDMGVRERIAADRLTGQHPGLPHSNNGSTP